jgi:hypothetical protein
MQPVTSEHLILPRFIRLMTDGFMQKHALDPVFPVSLARLELWGSLRERDYPRSTWGGLPYAHLRDLLIILLSEHHHTLIFRYSHLSFLSPHRLRIVDEY